MRAVAGSSTLEQMSPSADHLHVHTTRGTTHVTVSGDLDLHSREQTAAVLDELDKREADDVVVDLQELDFMDSTGVSALLTLAHTVRRRAGRVRLRGASTRDRFLLDVRGGLGLFDVDPDGADAIRPAQ